MAIDGKNVEGATPLSAHDHGNCELCEQIDRETTALRQECDELRRELVDQQEAIEEASGLPLDMRHEPADMAEAKEMFHRVLARLHAIDQAGREALPEEPNWVKTIRDGHQAFTVDMRHCQRDFDALRVAALGLVKRLEEVEKDAERYRWLRLHSWVDTSLIKSVLNFGPGYQQTNPETLDATIDAKRQGEK